MRDQLCVRGSVALWAVIAASLSVNGALGVEPADPQALIARISMPFNYAVIRGDIPVFGVAAGTDFMLYRVEYGVGRSPKKWQLIHTSVEPQPSDPWAMGKAKWTVGRGGPQGNLATWRTGLSSYEYADQTEGLNGVHTLRLVVQGKRGNTAEARVIVDVGRVIMKDSGWMEATSWLVESCDRRAFVHVDAESIPQAWVVISIQPIDPVDNSPIIELKPPKGLIPVGKTYEFRPPGWKFLRPIRLRMRYNREDVLRKEANGKARELPESKLGIYAYMPVDEVWARLPGCKVRPGEISVEFKEITRYVAFYAIMADITPPDPPAFDPAVTSTETHMVTVSGKAEPSAVVEIYREASDSADEKEPISAVQVNAEGAFTIPAFELKLGENIIAGRAVDGAGHASQPSQPVKIVRESHPPKSVKQLRVLGKAKAERGDKLSVKLVGEDSDAGANTTYAKILSESDKTGFELELTETGPATGVYVATFSVGEESDPGNNVIAALKHGEKITVTAVRDERRRAAVEYVDTVLPKAPEIDCPTHPSACQDTFEETSNPLGEWANVGDEYGAELSRETVDGNTYLKLTKQQHRSHLGAGNKIPYDVSEFPWISFDCLINPEVTMDVQIRRPTGVLLIPLNNDKGEKMYRGRDVIKPDAPFLGIVSDGKWHHAEIDLVSVIHPRYWFENMKVDEIQFINWDLVSYRRWDLGHTGAPGSYYCIDNFRILGYGGSEATFSWSSQDDDGIAGYSYVLDQKADTIPPEKITGTETTKTYAGLADGRWYFHVRARDRVGNWSTANHYMIFVDTTPPTAEFLNEAPEGKMDWAEPILIKIDDGDVWSVNPYSIRLEVNGQDYDVSSKMMSYDREANLLEFDFSKAQPQMLLADGEKVHAELGTAADCAGHLIEKPVSLSYVVRSPLKVTPAAPDGSNGWYVTPPQIEMGVTGDPWVAYEWAIPPAQDDLFRKGNSINVLRVAVTDKHGNRQQCSKPFKLDTTVPKVKAIFRGAEGTEKKPTIVLEHDDYALAPNPGGLNCRLYETSDFSGNPALSLEKADLRLGGVPPDVIRKSRSIRWSGRWLPPEPGTYKVFLKAGDKQRVRVAINGDTILDSLNAKKDQQEVSADVLLKKVMNPVEILWNAEDEVARPVVGLSWQTETVPRRELNSNELFALRNLAKVLYQWDDGEETEYTAPLVAPAGKHILQYYAIDEAGHESEKKKLELVDGTPQ